MQNTQLLIQAFLKKGGKITKCPTTPYESIDYVHGSQTTVQNGEFYADTLGTSPTQIIIEHMQLDGQAELDRKRMARKLNYTSPANAVRKQLVARAARAAQQPKTIGRPKKIKLMPKKVG